MSSKRSPIVPLLLAALAAIGIALAITRVGDSTRLATTAQPVVPVKPKWTATAPGRVEPVGGDIKLSAQSPGRIEEVFVRVNDKVVAGDLLVRLDDVDAIARTLGADAEAGVRKRERDGETNVPRLAQDRRAAEDKLNNTERNIALARASLDRLLVVRRAKPASVTAEQLSSARNALDVALKQLEVDREAHRQSQLAAGVPLPTRLESGLTASRAELSIAEAALERTRIRAPFDGTILQVNAHVGELAVATPEQPLVVIGDLARLRVRAEVEERDVTKVKVGQGVLMKADAFADVEFSGRVTSIAQSMRPPKLAQRGPRRPTDLDTLEVMVDVDAGTALLPGMRVDVFFKSETSGTTTPAKAEAAKSEAPAIKTEAAAPAAPAASAPAAVAPAPEAAPKSN